MPSLDAPAAPRLTTEQAAALLGYRCNRSVLRLVRAGVLKPLPYPRRPLHFWSADVHAILNGRSPMADEWGR